MGQTDLSCVVTPIRRPTSCPTRDKKSGKILGFSERLLNWYPTALQLYCCCCRTAPVLRHHFFYRLRDAAALERSELRRRHDVEVRANSTCNRFVCAYGIERSHKNYCSPPHYGTRLHVYREKAPALRSLVGCHRMARPWSRCSLCVCVAGAQQQDVKPRQQYQHVQFNNQVHIGGPHTGYTKHTSAFSTVAYIFTCHWNVCDTRFRLKTPPGYQINPIPEGNLVGSR